tara:strand:+ start:785 stop:1546 length:762 start_codon:yes stop_codon:yes gene_type:complete
MSQEVWIYSLASVFAVSLIAFVGLFTLSMRKKDLEKFILYMVAFAAGALIANAFLYLIPEAVELSGMTLTVSLLIIAGVIFPFLIEKFLHWHHCHHSPADHKHPRTKPFAIVSLFGDAVHNFIDGIIIGVAYIVSIPLGIATTVSVAIHEIPQEIGDFGVLLQGGFSKNKALFFNFLIALTSALGVIVALLLNPFVENLTEILIPFAAGGFIYIAAADLIPELHKETNTAKSIIQLFWFGLGILIMVALLNFG